ncbi:MAG: DinB family protein [Chloroflexales bacterium]|nr:DinB family protein [Chloroflexales bacterium]
MAQEITTRETIRADINAAQEDLQELMPRISDDDWYNLQRDDGWSIHDIVGHIADSSYGIARMLTAGLPPGAKLNIDERNAARRESMRTLPRAEIEQRLASGFDAARETLSSIPDLNAPGPPGIERNAGQCLAIIPLHVAAHQQEIEDLLAGRRIVGGDT